MLRSRLSYILHTTERVGQQRAAIFPRIIHRTFFQKRSTDSGPSLSSYVAKAPTKDLPSWKRLAELIKDGDADSPIVDSVYMARLRTTHDVRDHVEKIEEEILEEMASALGRTGDKCNYHFLLLEQQGIKCDQAMKVVYEEVLKLKAFSVCQLKEQCKSLNLPISGTKFTLIRNIMNPIKKKKTKNAQVTSSEPNSHNKKFKTSYDLLVEEVSEFNRLRHEAENARRELIIHRQAIGFQTGNYSAIEKAWPLPSRRVLVEEAKSGYEVGIEESVEEERNREWIERLTHSLM